MATKAYQKLASLLAALTGVVGVNSCVSSGAFPGNNPNVYAEVADVMRRYDDALAQADQAALVELLDPILNSKRMAALNGRLVV